MNRWTYYIVSQRLKNGGKEVYRPRKMSRARKIANILGIIFGVAFLGLIVVYAGIGAILAGLLFFGTIYGGLYTLHTGKELLLYESDIVKNQLNNNIPIDFNVKRAKLGFFMAFAPIYVMMFIAGLVPGGWLWFVPYMPFFAICLILTYMSHGFIEIFNFSHAKYRLCHLCAHLFVFTASTLIRELIITPNI